jgi:hypothetical protein
MEHEILGHSRKIVKLSRATSMSFWHKLREISIEIVIIVFAVSLAAFIERYREHEHEQGEVKEFLLGLRTDFKKDLVEMNNDLAQFKRSRYFMKMISEIPQNQQIPKDTLRKYSNVIFSQVKLVPNSGLYDGFKASGKLGNIENHKLLTTILDVYQEDIPILLESTDYQHSYKNQLLNYIVGNAKYDANNKPVLSPLLTHDYAKLMCRAIYSSDEQIISLYETLQEKTKKVIELIDKEYGKAEET